MSLKSVIPLNLRLETTDRAKLPFSPSLFWRTPQPIMGNSASHFEGSKLIPTGVNSFLPLWCIIVQKQRKYKYHPKARHHTEKNIPKYIVNLQGSRNCVSILRPTLFCWDPHPSVYWSLFRQHPQRHSPAPCYMRLLDAMPNFSTAEHHHTSQQRLDIHLGISNRCGKIKRKMWVLEEYTPESFNSLTLKSYQASTGKKPVFRSPWLSAM